LKHTKPRALEPDKEERHVLRLYVAGITPRSMRAVQNIKRICEAELAGHYDLEIVDLYKQPQRAAQDQIVAVPTLVTRASGGATKLIGDLSQEARVRVGLGLPKLAPTGS